MEDLSVEVTRLGATINVALSRAPANALAVLTLSPVIVPTGTLIGGALVYPERVDSARVYQAISADVGLDAGSTSLRVRLPFDPTFIGTDLYAQWVIVDPAHAGTFSATRAMRLRIID